MELGYGYKQKKSYIPKTIKAHKNTRDIRVFLIVADVQRVYIGLLPPSHPRPCEIIRMSAPSSCIQQPLRRHTHLVGAPKPDAAPWQWPT